MQCRKSLSARRAWIEIEMRHNVYRDFAVALRKESVDRNMVSPLPVLLTVSSLSARRAWIEMDINDREKISATPVALRKESVDRNSRGRDCG